MRIVKDTLALSLLALCAFSFAAGNGGGKGQSESERARKLLLKTLERGRPQNVVAIILQRSPGWSDVMQRIQVQISKDGKMRQTVIYPLSMEGVETIDDGRQSATYLPDDKLTLIQESPRLMPNDTLTRMNLTTRNYGLSLAGTSVVAGKTATIVVATPHNRDMETRRYYIDADTGFLLQLETIGKSKEPKLAFKAQVVSYPSSIPSQTFSIDQAKSGKTLVFRRRSGIYDGNKDAQNLGFEPVFPDALPYGFSVQDAQINDNVQWRSVAVRITDGLIKGTVYQWPASSKNVKVREMPGTTMGESGGMKLVVAADVPESVRRRILEAFSDAARRGGNDGSQAFAGFIQSLELSLRQISLTHIELPAGILLITVSNSINEI